MGWREGNTARLEMFSWASPLGPEGQVPGTVAPGPSPLLLLLAPKRGSPSSLLFFSQLSLGARVS